MIICGTGHRPNKLGGYSSEIFEKIKQLAINSLENMKPEAVISGMAQGWDQALAVASLDLEIPLIAAIPFSGQHLRWTPETQEIYLRIVDRCHSVVIISEGTYRPSMMQIRNEWMVDHSDLVLALWDGSTGGTGNCIRYAKQKSIPIKNLWNTFKDIKNENDIFERLKNE